jgi:predicted alpha-1,2-mannosidase
MKRLFIISLLLATVMLLAALALSGCGRGARVSNAGPSFGDDDDDNDDDSAGGDDDMSPPLPDGYADIQSNAFVGASVPFGMITWGPNTATGYSLTDLSGAEMASEWTNYVPIRPSISGMPAALTEIVDNINQGDPGYFKGGMKSGGQLIGVELTATTRTGFGKITYPPATDGKLLFICTQAAMDNANQISGMHTQLADFKVYFVAQFAQPIAKFSTFLGGVIVEFDKATLPVLQMKVGMSYVSIANAAQNLAAENTGWDFDAVRASAAAAWTDALTRIELKGETAAEQKLFYTYFYQALHHPSIVDDVNGEYRGFDWQVYQVEAGRHHYSSYSIWDIYRGEIELLAWLFPQRVGDMMQSLVLDAQQDAGNGGGDVMPRWVVAERETGTMETGSATPLVTSAYAFGARDFDLEGAWQAMDRVETINGLMNQRVVEHYRIGDFMSLGYVPYYTDYQGKQCASFTLEYCIGHYALAQFATALGKTADAANFLALSHNWQNLFNADSRYIQPKMPDGTWMPDFSPTDGHFNGFVEGSSAQYTWLIMHDWDLLFQKMGGDDAVVARLDVYFTELNAAYDNWDSPYHCAGNEPGFFTAWAYNSANAPFKTQQTVRRILTELFDKQSPGADDLGAMSAWYVWASLGFYPVVPGTDQLAVHGPRYPEIVVHYADNQGRLTIAGAGANVAAPYIQSVSLNGEPLTNHRITLAQLTESAPGEIEFTMSSNPTDWGTRR